MSVQPARIQTSKSELSSLADERYEQQQHELGGGAVFNLWHRKWAGADKRLTQHRSPYRCQLDKDSGSTRGNGPYFCLWFARGCCHKGSQCAFLHRRPENEDRIKLMSTNTKDCFGRAKFSDFRDDMSGVGSFLKPSRTLFVGYFDKSAKPKLLHTQLRQQFGEWGEVTSVRLDRSSSYAFISFEYQCNAEFAKEAMSNQTITGKETLVVKWAKNDKDSEVGVDETRIREIVRNVLKERRERNRKEEGKAILEQKEQQSPEEQSPEEQSQGEQIDPGEQSPGEQIDPAELLEPPLKKRKGAGLV